MDSIQVARFFDNVELLVVAMNLCAADKQDVLIKVSSHGTRNAVCHCLQCWIRQDPAQATFYNLLDIVNKLGREDIAIEIKKYVSDGHIPFSESI